MASSTRGPGRPKGSPNKASSDVKLLAKTYGPDAILRLAQMAGFAGDGLAAESEALQLAAIRELLDRGYGKCAQPQVGAGGEGNPITEVIYRWAHEAE